MAELNIIDDEDLKAPLRMAANYNKLADSYDEVIKIVSKLVGSIDSLDNTIQGQTKATKELDKSTKKLEATNKKAAASMESFAAASEYADGAMGGAISRTKQLNATLLKLAANPVGLVLLAIGAALLAIGTYFRNTNEGADKFEEIMSAIRAVVQLVQVKIVDLGRELVKLFESGNAVGAAFRFVFDQIVNRVTGVIDSFTHLLRIINILSQYNLKDIITGNFSDEDVQDLKTSISDLGKSYVAVLTGIGTAAEEAAAKVESLVALTKAADTLGDNIRDNILAKAKTELEVEKLLFESKDKINKTDEERLDALTKSIELSQKQLAIDLDLARRRERIFTAELLQAKGIITTNEEVNKVLEQGTTEYQNQRLEVLALDDELEKRRKLQADVVNLERTFFSENRRAVSQISALQEEIERERFKISEEGRAARIALLERQQREATDIFAKETEEFLKQKEFKEGIEKRFNERILEDKKKFAERQKEIEKEQTAAYQEELKKREEARVVFETALALGQELVRGFTDQRIAKLDEELAASEERRKAELAAAGDNEQKKLAINRKFDREQARIKQKQAQAEKQGALFSVLINTAANIARVAPNPVLIALVAAIGAVQAALIRARPLPKFKTGTSHSPANFIAGDGGRELVSYKGKSFMADRPSVFLGMPGAKVFTNKETEGIVKNGLGPAIAAGATARLGGSVVYTGDNNSESVKWLKAIAKRPSGFVNIDQYGFSVGYLSKADKMRARYKRLFNGI